MTRIGKSLIAIAALWAVGVSLYILFSPVEVSGVTATLRRTADEVLETFTRQQSWYETEGLWGVMVIVIVGAFYLLAVRVAWQGKGKALLLMSFFAVVLSILSGFSIGAAYLPAALGLLLGAVSLHLA